MNKQLLNSMYRRRMSCPQVVQQLWDAVKVIRYQRQVPNLERIAKYMSRVFSVSEEEVVRQLGYCVRDGLLLITKRKGNKGTKSGVEQEGYKLPESPADRDKHDWYCSECHTGGDVIPCGACHRVYHLSCINNLPGTKQKYHCSVCQTSMQDKSLPNVKQKTLNKLLLMVSRVLRDRYPALIKSSEYLQRSITIGSPGAQIDIGSESWRVSYLIHRPCDITKMAATAKKGGYTNLSQFCADAATIVHNVVIFQGVHSSLADKARMMSRDCQTEIFQVRRCHTCYQTTGVIKGITKRKFTALCRPPHQLVYARDKGFSYWPAKVVHEDGDKLDVWFFGHPHERTTVDRLATLPITTNVNTLVTKRTSSWNRACEELKRHQNLLNRLEDGTYESTSSDSDISVKSEKSFKSDKSFGEKSIKSEKSVKNDFVEKSPVRETTPFRETTPVVEVKRPIRRTRTTPGKSSQKSSSDDSSDEEFEKVVVQRKKRGRPPLKKSPEDTPPKKKRGRPPKKSKEETSVVGLEVAPPKTVEIKEEEEEKPEEIPAEPPLSSVQSPVSNKNEEEIVSSSCMEPQFRTFGTQTKHDSRKDRANKELIAKMREEMEQLKELHAEQLKEIRERHAQELAIAKKKQWCYHCEQEAIYHCCWNTAYCSTECQQIHWQGEHKRVCRRKR